MGKINKKQMKINNIKVNYKILSVMKISLTKCGIQQLYLWQALFKECICSL